VDDENNDKVGKPEMSSYSQVGGAAMKARTRSLRILVAEGLSKLVDWNFLFFTVVETLM